MALTEKQKEYEKSSIRRASKRARSKLPKAVANRKRWRQGCKWKAAHILQERRRRAKARLVCLVCYGGNPPLCACCGEWRLNFLGMDHMNGGGAAHRREIGRGNITHWLTKNNFPKGFQVLCHNCNLAKGFYGHCPHE